MKITVGLDVKRLWNVFGDFPHGRGDVSGTVVETDTGYCYANQDCRLTASLEKCLCGVFSRKDTFENVTDAPIKLRSLMSRFCYDGGEYDVYIQYNGWEHESIGGWQSLLAGAEIHSESVRNVVGAAPFLVVWNVQTNRGTAFHLLADGAWRIRVTRVPIGGGKNLIEVELGLDDRNLELQIAPGEKLELPEILCYEVRNRVDLDCWKLHRYFNDAYPRREMPVVYNTWLCTFSDLSYENVAKQIPLAQKLGAEYFTIDAGWFGNDPDWTRSIGDWFENEHAGFCGEMARVAQNVRDHGMKFGLWFEIERALMTSEAIQKHPSLFLEYDGHGFLDFANPDARAYILELLTGMITKYGIEFIKFDFNKDMLFDVYRSSFTAYHQGYLTFIRELKARFPSLYLENCASGGQRMNLQNCRYFDSYWFTDNQSPYDGLTILKNTMLRMPSQLLERWVSVVSVPNIRTYLRKSASKVLSTNSATWEDVVGIDESYLKGFLTGGPMGFSCDLTKFSEEFFAEMCEFVAEFKKNRSFWMQADCRILTDTPSLLVLQYSDPKLDKIVLQAFSKQFTQLAAHIFPAIDPAAEYCLEDGTPLRRETLMEDGITLDISDRNRMVSVVLSRRHT